MRAATFERRAAEMRERAAGGPKRIPAHRRHVYRRRKTSACTCGTCRRCHFNLYRMTARARERRHLDWLWERATAEWRTAQLPTAFQAELSETTRRIYQKVR